MNKRCCNCFSSSKIKSATNTPKITNMTETRFRDGRYVVRHRQSGPLGQQRSGPSRPRLEAKTKAKAWTLEAKAKAKTWSLKAKAKDIHFCPRGSSRPRPGLEDYIT